MKDTLRSRCLSDGEPFLTDGVIAVGSYKKALKDIHTKVVSEAVEHQSHNPILDRPPPNIHEEETLLPRNIRSTLSQLRSSHCQRLKSFQHRIGKTPDELCPECGILPHTSSHLFSCLSHPTSLNPVDLWENPWEVAQFLTTLPQFSHLPPPGPRPPPRRLQRQRPPRAPPDIPALL